MLMSLFHERTKQNYINFLGIRHIGPATGCGDMRLSQQMYLSPCGYIYDPGIGNPDAIIEPGTAFEEIFLRIGPARHVGAVKKSLKKNS